MLARFFRPQTCFEIDDPAGGPAATLGEGAVEPAAVAPLEPAEPVEIPAQEPAAPAEPTGEPPAPEPLDLDGLTSEQVMELVEKHPDAILSKVDPRSAIGRLATVAKERTEARNQLTERDTELERLRAQPTTEPQPPKAGESPEGLDPYLVGKVANFDPEDKLVQLDTESSNWFTQKEAMRIVKAEEFGSRYDQDVSTRERVDAQAKELEAVQKAEAQVAKDIEAVRAAIPALTEIDAAKAAKFDTNVKARFETSVREFAAKNAAADGTVDYSLLTDEVVSELINEAAAEEAEYLGYGSNLQLKVKAEAARTEPLPSSGSAVMPAGKKWGDLTEREQEEIMEAKAEQIIPQIGV